MERQEMICRYSLDRDSVIVFIGKIDEETFIDIVHEMTKFQSKMSLGESIITFDPDDDISDGYEMFLIKEYPARTVICYETITKRPISIATKELDGAINIQYINHR